MHELFSVGQNTLCPRQIYINTVPPYSLTNLLFKSDVGGEPAILSTSTKRQANYSLYTVILEQSYNTHFTICILPCQCHRRDKPSVDFPQEEKETNPETIPTIPLKIKKIKRHNFKNPKIKSLHICIMQSFCSSTLQYNIYCHW